MRPLALPQENCEGLSCWQVLIQRSQCWHHLVPRPWGHWSDELLPCTRWDNFHSRTRWYSTNHSREVSEQKWVRYLLGVLQFMSMLKVFLHCKHLSPLESTTWVCQTWIPSGEMVRRTGCPSSVVAGLDDECGRSLSQTPRCVQLVQ